MSDAIDARRHGARLTKTVFALPRAFVRGLLHIPTALVNLMEKHGTEK